MIHGKWQIVNKINVHKHNQPDDKNVKVTEKSETVILMDRISKNKIEIFDWTPLRR